LSIWAEIIILEITAIIPIISSVAVMSASILAFNVLDVDVDVDVLAFVISNYTEGPMKLMQLQRYNKELTRRFSLLILMSSLIALKIFKNSLLLIYDSFI
jgi:hypothetical protein